MTADELQDGKTYKVTRNVLNTWSEGDLFRCDRRVELTYLIILKYKKTHARSLNSHNPDFRVILGALQVVES